MKKSRIGLGAAMFSVGMLVSIDTLQAEEGGAGHYIPGSLATLIDLPPTDPGWYLGPVYLRYEGEASASRRLPIGGQVALNMDATTDAFSLVGIYSFETPVLGASYSVAAIASYVSMDVSATVTTPGGPVQRSDSEDGFGDMSFIPAMMGWKMEDWQFNFILPIYAPTGDYEAGRLANPGRNHWTFDPTIGVSYNGSENGFNAAIHTGIAYNTENDETDYQSGAMWHVELSAQQLFPVGRGYMGVGANGFYYQQITGDSGSGAVLGDFKGHTTGIGPVLTYLLPMDGSMLLMEARWLPELETDHRLKGEYFWLKAVCQF